MSAAYFEILNDFPKGCWYLGSLFDALENEIDLADLTYGKRVEVREPLIIEQYRRGKPQNFTLARFDVPVVGADLAKKLQKVAGEDLQILPVRVAHVPDDYAVLNLLTMLPCLDEARTRVTLNTEEERAGGKRGKYRMVGEIYIDPAVARNHAMFRIQDWPIAVICSKPVHDLLRSERVKGIDFRDA